MKRIYFDETIYFNSCIHNCMEEKFLSTFPYKFLIDKRFIKDYQMVEYIIKDILDKKSNQYSVFLDKDDYWVILRTSKKISYSDLYKMFEEMKELGAIIPYNEFERVI